MLSKLAVRCFEIMKAHKAKFGAPPTIKLLCELTKSSKRQVRNVIEILSKEGMVIRKSEEEYVIVERNPVELVLERLLFRGLSVSEVSDGLLVKLIKCGAVNVINGNLKLRNRMAAELIVKGGDDD